MKQEKAVRFSTSCSNTASNHIDTAAAYGDSELRIAPWMRQHRKRFYPVNKTGVYQGASESVHRSHKVVSDLTCGLLLY
jgi:aryl-alcohol dehydrogenase-like predicted oxidoreductase